MRVSTINSFDISVSKQRFADKNAINWGCVKYIPRNITINEFEDLIKQGHCFCQCFTTKGKEFGLQEKTDANFSHAQMIFIDIDDADIDMNTFVYKLSKQPTISYTTPNNYTEKSNFKYRFRLCYLFDEAITNIAQYQFLYDTIINTLAKDIDGFICKDNCGRSVSQQFSGNGTRRCELQRTDIVYSFSDFPIQNNNASFSSLLVSNGKTDKPKTPIIKDVEIADEAFISDVHNLKPIDLIEKYRNKYQYFTSTELRFEDGYALIPENYLEIYRSWCIDTIQKKNGDSFKVSIVKKVRDGNNRRKKLFVAALIMKKIHPNITFEHLLFNLIYERQFYYDNSDKVLTNKELIRIAKEVVSKNAEEISLNSREKRKFVVDKAYCHEHGITPNAMKNKVRKKLKDDEIGSVYDCSLSLKENLSMMREMGMKIGKSRLYLWCKENGISSKGAKICYHAPLQEIKELQYYYYLSSSREDKQVYRKQIASIAELIRQEHRASA